MIPDYLIEKEVWWKERDGCIEFFDYTGDVESYIETKHFRSTTMFDIEKYLSEIWKGCDKSHIPAKSIIEGENDETLTKLQTLRYFQLPSDEMDVVCSPPSIGTMENSQNDDGGIHFDVCNKNSDSLPGPSSSCYREGVQAVFQNLNAEDNLDAMDDEDKESNAED